MKYLLIALFFVPVLCNGQQKITISAVSRSNTSTDYIDVFLIAGQSNAVGAGEQSFVTVPTPNKVLQFKYETFRDANDVVGIHDVSVTNDSGSAWPSFGLNWYTISGHKILFVPSGRGGTSQTAAATTANGNWDTTGVLFDSSVARLNRALTKITAAGFTPIVRGILWCQGETDAQGINNSITTAAAYKAAFRKMIGRYRQNFSRIPFYIFRTGTDTTGSDVGYAAVRTAQMEVANADTLTNIVFWDAVDYPRRHLMFDQYHYNRAGYYEMGRKAAENILASAGQKWQSYNDTASSNKYLYFVGGSVSIGAASIAASAKLDVSSTTQGVLIPRMTTTQRNAISSPAEGLAVYDLTLHKLYVYDGSVWQAAW